MNILNEIKWKSLSICSHNGPCYHKTSPTHKRTLCMYHLGHNLALVDVY